ncbi:transcription-repair coupling factor [Candidatus Endobugula sertula]|uniref:Transcription-repair-coupling factor n=1 Tax=Candidatus Endobugula sertula TaxID=62101 RepID=A0A1D2QSW9_9GAMM|nr:transcription-repair coupling factor [Candidatus Endobugula sertula]
MNPKGNKQLWGGLHGSATALAIVNAVNKEQTSLVITPNIASANQLLDELHFFAHKTDIFAFTGWETLPYDMFSPHEDIVSTRLQTLYNIIQGEPGVVVTSINTLMCPLPPPDYLKQQSLIIKQGDQCNIENMRQQFELSGYRCVDTVYTHGEFAVRGSLLDLFPMGSRFPYRVDLFDDEIETLRTFDPETQRSLQQVEGIHLLPGKEFPLDETGIRDFRRQWHERFDVDHRQCPIYQDVSDGIAPAGIEYYLPLFFTQRASLFDYLPKNTQLFSFSNVEAEADHFWREIYNRYESHKGDVQRPILKPAEIFLPVQDVFAKIKDFNHRIISQSNQAHIVFNSQTLPTLSIEAQQSNPYTALENFLTQREQRVLFCVESAGRREALLTSLQNIKVKPEYVDSWETFIHSNTQLAITETVIENGFILDDPAIAVITETQLFGNQVKQRRRRRTSQDGNEQIIKNLTELKVGAPVVHLDHGIGRYCGLQTLSIDNQDSEFLMLEYAEQAKLYVPVTHLHLISRYTSANEGLAPLHKLGSSHWQKTKEKAAREVHDVAAELLEIYAKRDAREGYAFPYDKTDYERFASAFPFEETPDQEAAIQAVRNDMLSPKSMDRLVCGDVGFGKTEVAMRAAFIATQAIRQVAVLVPTTLLAQQHYENFVDRFVDWPINIEVVSRFCSTKDLKRIEEEIANGKIDILIGTHKIITSHFQFKSLGLLIIDEEHRFGVRQKETIKALRSEVDILTLTATPIPRTLNMAIHNIRDLSIIATPPARRLSVKTFIRQADNNLVKEAISREILRGGQVYFLHNEVKSIEKTARELAELLPEARVGIAHGQLREKELEQVMSDFYHLRHNILVCSTIIETGIDVPNANTIIIERADKFGLAQLHQLRGRVGRSHHQAYAYLLTPPPKQMTDDAEKRLEAIANADDLGAGFTLATHDLEIRGAGELLGDKQSGQMQAIGFSLYMEMLEQAVTAIRKGKSLKETLFTSSNIDVNLHIPALIPDEYLPDVHTRLIFYKRLSAISDSRGFDDLQVEMIDRFGLLPEPTKHLIRVTQLKLQAEELGITKIDANAKRGLIEFSTTPKVDPLTIVKMVQNQPQNYQLRGANRLLFNIDMMSAEDRLKTTEAILTQLTATH